MGWIYDGTSDFGRIDRQNAFLRAMVDQAQQALQPAHHQRFLSKLPQGITLDKNFSLNELIGLAVRFHNLSANAIQTYTLPTVAANNTSLGDVLYVDQPAAQQLLVNIFGNQLEAPTNPPPNTALQTPPPPVVTTTTTTWRRPHNDEVPRGLDGDVDDDYHESDVGDTVLRPEALHAPRPTRRARRGPGARCSRRASRT